MRLAKAARWAAGIERGQDLGQHWAFTVLSLSHARGETLRNVYDGLLRSWRRMRQVNGGRAFAEHYGQAYGFAPDIVVGGPNGPHPHLNVLHSVPSTALDVVDVDVEERMIGVRRTRQEHGAMIDLWETCVREACGGKRIALGQIGCRSQILPGSLDGHSTETADVPDVARYAMKVPGSASFEALENRYRTSGAGRTLMELAVAAHEGDDDAGRLLARCSADLRGKRSATESADFKQLCDEAGAASVDDDTDAEAVWSALVEDEPVCVIRHGDWRSNRHDLERALSGAEQRHREHGREAAVEWFRKVLDSLGIEPISWYG